MAILITGGTGYIGSHTCVELLNNVNEDIIIVDNLVNSKIEVLESIKKITNKEVKFYKIDVLDRENLEKVFEENKIDSVIHFAGLKAVGESVQFPLKYYINNVSGTLTLLDVMKKYNVKKIVFSSTATVYGNPKIVPVTEDMPLFTTNTYATTKLHIEQILKELYNSDNEWSITILRYFNPIGAHESGLIGESPNGIPNNLMPYIARVAIGKLEKLNIFGNDYDTHDGTGVRDYIHVVDLAKGHLKALEKLNAEKNGLFIYNLGTGVGYSVLDVVNTFESVNNVKINYEIVGRRAGDVAIYYADPSKAKTELGWIATKDLKQMCKDVWNFQQNVK